ncbi:MAG: hypothetical protein LCH51_14400 [Bacteroidetes bacterium]|nr:hypothetical protein [Bacteroidota bacterium]
MRNGEKVKGYLIGVKEERNSISGAVTFEYDVEYSVYGKLTRKVFVSSPESLEFQVGDTVPVVYSNFKPSISLLEPQLSDYKPTLFALIFCVIVVVVSVLFLINIVRGKRTDKKIA